MKRVLYLAVALGAALLFVPAQQASAQQTTLKKADIPHIVVDTLPTDRDDVRIVTFSDGTFRFVPTDPRSLDSIPAYMANWDTVNIFAYRSVELRDLPEMISVEIAGTHTSQFRAPAVGRVLSKYGPRGRRAHNGVDIQVAHGQPIFAAFDGVVRYSRWNSGGFGNLIIIRHANGLETYYAHLSRRAVRAGEWVRAGSVIGYGGRTGRATANHLHFEVRYSDQTFDPERIIDFTTGDVRRGVFPLRKEYFNIRSRAVEGIEEDDESVSMTNPPADSTAVKAASGSVNGEDGGEGEKATQPEPVYHIVSSGDNLWTLSRRYGTTVARICELNGISRNSTLKIGRRLRIK